MKKIEYSRHHPIPTSRERRKRHENIEDTEDIVFKNLIDQPTTRLNVSEHDALHRANTKKIDQYTSVPMTPREMLFKYLHIHANILSNKAKIEIIQLLQLWKQFYDEKYVK